MVNGGTPLLFIHPELAAMEAGVKKALKGVPLPLRSEVRKALLG